MADEDDEDDVDTLDDDDKELSQDLALSARDEGFDGEGIGDLVQGTKGMVALAKGGKDDFDFGKGWKTEAVKPDKAAAAKEVSAERGAKKAGGHVLREPEEPKSEFDFGKDWKTEIVPKKAVPGEYPGSSLSIVRGLVTGGIQGNIGDMGDFIDASRALAGGDPNNPAAKLANALESAAKGSGEGYGRKVPKFTDIHGLGDVNTYIWESLGQAIGSSAPSFAGGVLGATVGAGLAGAAAAPTVVGEVAAVPAGATVGGIVGSSIPSFISGVGGVWGDIKKDPEIQKALKDGKISEQQLSLWAWSAGGVIGAVDAVSFQRLRKIVGLSGEHSIWSTTVRETALKLIKEGAKHGIKSEGPTEMLQQLIQESAVVLAGGQKDYVGRAINVIDAGLQGLIGGAGMGGAGGVRERIRRGAPDAVPDPAAATPAQPGTTGAGAPPPPPPAGAAGTSTPGGPGPGPAPQPAGATAAPAGEAGKATPAAATPPAAGVADPSIAAALSTEPTYDETSDLTAEDEARAAAEGKGAIPMPDESGQVVTPPPVTPQSEEGPTYEQDLEAANAAMRPPTADRMKSRAKAAQQTTAAEPNADINEALKAAVPPPQTSTETPSPAAPGAQQAPPAEPPAAGPTTMPPPGGAEPFNRSQFITETRRRDPSIPLSKAMAMADREEQLRARPDEGERAANEQWRQAADAREQAAAQQRAEEDARAREETVRAYQQRQPQPETVPETPATLKEQRDQLVRGERKAVMYPKGTKPKDVGKVPKGMKSIRINGAVFHYNPALVSKEEVIRASREGRENEILGLGPFNKEEVAATGAPEMAVAERTPEGVEVRAAGATPATAPVQQAAMEAGKTPGNIVAPEPIDQTLAARAAPKAEKARKKSKERVAAPQQAGVGSAPAPEPPSPHVVPAPSTAPAAAAATAKERVPPGPSPKAELAKRQSEARAKREAAEKASYAPEPAPAPGPAPAAKKKPTLTVKPGKNVPEAKPAERAPVAEEKLRAIREKKEAEGRAPPPAPEAAPTNKRRAVAAEVTAHVEEVLKDAPDQQAVRDTVQHAVTERIDNTMGHMAHRLVAEIADTVKAAFPPHAVQAYYDERVKAAEAAKQAHAKAEAAKTVSARRQAEAEARAKEAGKAGTKEEKGRIGKESVPTPENIRGRKRSDFEHTVRDQMKALGDKAPQWMKDAWAAMQERKTVGRGGGPAMDEKRAPYNERIEAAKEAWAKEAEGKHAAKPKPKPITEAEEIEERATAAERAKAEREAAAEVERGKALSKADQHAKGIVEVNGGIPSANEVTLFPDTSLKRIQKILKEFGKVPAQVNRALHGPWVNFLAYAKQALKNSSQSPEENLIDVGIAHDYLTRGEIVDFYGHIAEDQAAQAKGRETVREGEEGEAPVEKVETLPDTAPSPEEILQQTQEEEARIKAENAEMEAERQAQEEHERRLAEGPEPEPDTDIEDRAAKPAGDIFSNAESGYEHPTPIKPVRAADALAKAIGRHDYSRFGVLRGRLMKIIDKTAARMLTKLVGHVPVYYVNAEELANISPDGAGSGGLWVMPNQAGAARGHKGVIFINTDARQVSPGLERQLLLHEMTHAALEWAYKTNYLNTRNIVNALWNTARRQASRAGITVFPSGDTYGLSRSDEFMTEMMSNPRFQNMVGSMHLEPKMRDQLQALAPGSEPSILRAFAAQITRVLGIAKTGANAIAWANGVMKIVANVGDEQALRAHIARHRPSQKFMIGTRLGFNDARSHVRINGKVVGEEGTGTTPAAGVRDFPSKTAEDLHDEIYDRQLPLQQVTESRQALNARRIFQHDVRPFFRRWVSDTTQSTQGFLEEFKRITSADGKSWFDGPARRLVFRVLNGDQRRREIATEGHPTIAEWGAFANNAKTRDEADTITGIFDQGTKVGIDPTVPITDPANRHANNNKAVTLQQRGTHDRLHKQWNALSKEAKAIALKVKKFFTDLHARVIDAVIDQTLRPLMTHNAITLPSGETYDTVKAWIKDGSIDKTGAAMSQRDIDLHDALGKVADKIQRVTSVRLLPGIYIPLMRRGNYALAARKNYETGDYQPWVPPAQQKPGVNYFPEGAREYSEDQIVFDDKALFEKYMKSTEDQHIGYPKVRPANKKGQTFRAIVRVQNEFLSFFKSASEAQAERERLLTEGHYKADEIDQVNTRQKTQTQEEFEHQLMPYHIRAITKAFEQMGLTGTALKRAKDGVVLAHIQSLAGGGARAQHRRMKREAVKGNSTSLFEAMIDTNNAAAGFIMKTEAAQEKDNAYSWMENDIKETRNQEDVRRKEELLKEIRSRDEANYGRSGDWLERSTSVSFIYHLFSPMYVGMQAMQMITSTWPALAGPHGRGAAFTAMIKAGKDLGGSSLFGAGFRNSYKALKAWKTSGIDPTAQDTIQMMFDRQNLTLGERLMLRFLVQNQALAPNAGQDIEIKHLQATAFDRGISWATRILSGITEAIESYNRGVTGLSAYRLGIRDGMGEEAAREYALKVVNDQQYIYARSNYATMFGKPLGRFALQFKKFGIGLDNYMYRSAAQMIRTADPKQRKEIAKSLAYMALAFMFFSGASGGLPWEPVKLLWMLANVAGLGKTTFEDAQNGIERLLRKGVGKSAAEALMHGIPRLLNIDMSQRISLSSTLTFGQPKNNDDIESLQAWLFRNMQGAPAEMLIKFMTMFNDPKGDLISHLPLPKVVRDTYHALKEGKEGVYTKSGRQVGKPLTAYEMFVKAFGATPATQAEQWEPGGGGLRFKEKGDIKKEKDALTARWYKAVDQHDTAGRQAAMKAMRDWNKANRKDAINLGSLAKTLSRRRSDAIKEKRELMKE